MDDDHLIECVRQYDVLYDFSNPKYMDTSYRNEIWNKIAEQLKSDVSACKARWNNIRDNYRKSLKKSGQSAKKIKNYKFANELSFIDKYFGKRKVISITNIKYENGQEEEENMQSDSEEQLPEDDLQSQYSLNPVQTNDISLQVATKTTKPQFSKSSDFQPPDAAKLLDYLKSIKKEESQTSTGLQHPVDAFLCGIAPSLKSLSPYNLHLAKSEIFSVVQKYELQQILGENSSMTSVASLPSPCKDQNTSSAS